jgi:glycogen debranching enzyme
MTSFALDRLISDTASIGDPAWREMLQYVARLHERSIHAAGPPFPFPWEEIGPGYCYGPAFGHFDITHQAIDVVDSEPEHARRQLLNNLANQQPDGMVPGVIWMDGREQLWLTHKSYPPAWVMGVDEHVRVTGSSSLVAECYPALLRQIEWFRGSRAVAGGGYFYLDIYGTWWESGVDEGVRYLDSPKEPHACVDATSHVFLLNETAARWSEVLGRDAAPFAEEAAGLGRMIRERLWADDAGFFFDSWSAADPTRRRISFEGFWPLVVGAAAKDQADAIIDRYLLSPDHFFGPHPITTVSRSDPAFELRMWRGPAWNSMTYWVVRGCCRYGRHDAARTILRAALDSTAEQYRRTGTVWEFYHPDGLAQEDLQRKPATPYNTPCRDYLGHNPVIAMARLYDRLSEEE